MRRATYVRNTTAGNHHDLMMASNRHFSKMSHHQACQEDIENGDVRSTELAEECNWLAVAHRTDQVIQEADRKRVQYYTGYVAMGVRSRLSP